MKSCLSSTLRAAVFLAAVLVSGTASADLEERAAPRVIRGSFAPIVPLATMSGMSVVAGALASALDRRRRHTRR